VTRQFERVAGTVSERTADLLSARVLVLDERGAVIASSAPGSADGANRVADHAPEPDYLRVPIRLDGQVGEVLVGEPGNGEVVSPRLAKVLVELMVNQTAVVARLPDQHALKHKFIHDLLRGSNDDEGDLLREGQILGMDFSRPRAVILIDASAYILGAEGAGRADVSEARTRRRAQLVIASVVGFFALPDDTICGYIGDGEVAVLKASSTQDLVAWTDKGSPNQSSASWANLSALKRATAELLTRLRRDTNAAINVGLGRYHPGVQGLARSYQDARAALSLGRRFHGQNQVHCLDGLGIAAFVGLADEHTKIDLAMHLLSPLDHAPELLETLDTFFAQDCCPSATAKQLCIHRNTLSYRLDKITALTGLDPRRFDEAMQVRLAILLRALRGSLSDLHPE
jgi:carbohydrate diacid regulator